MERYGVKGAATRITGAVKKAFGRATGDRKTEVQGRVEAKGEAQNTIGGVKDKLRDSRE